ncbi:MAG: ABC transporter substrate-binding protein [Methanocorpusculum sp.]|nr:ABC transporter substrate-binding protein [Methanocorpusculum sp.]
MKYIAGIVLVLALFCAAAGCVSTETGSLKITNSDGSTTALSAPVERIVLLNSNAGEILYLLGDADKVVGISKSIADNTEQRKMYPDAVVVGLWNEPDVEYLISLNVDLVIGYATSKPKNAEVLAASGIPIVYIDCTKPATMAQDIVEVGKIAGNTKRAEEIAAFYTDVMDTVWQYAAPFSMTRSVYAESYTAYFGQGTDTGMGQLISHAGGWNIMDIPGAKKLSDEWVVTKNPEIIVKLVNSMKNKEEVYAELQTRTGFSGVRAVQDGYVWLIRNDLTYGPRSCVAAAAMLEILHPNSSIGITAEGVLKEFNEKFGTQFETEDITYPKL